MLMGEQVVLRPLERGDLGRLATWRNDPRARPHFFNPYPITVSSQDKWYEGYLARRDALLFIIEDKSDGHCVGSIGLDHIDHLNQSAEYGRVLIADAADRQRGYARDASIVLLGYAFGELNLNRIYLEVFADNEPAIRLYERCHFQREGVKRQAIFAGGCFRDVLLMSILRPEFQPASNP
jgi:diamine N-acetyltransferase